MFKRLKIYLLFDTDIILSNEYTEDKYFIFKISKLKFFP